MGQLLFGLFLIVPMIEIALFIMLGQTIGLWPTLLGVVVTALIGSIVIRLQGVALLLEIRQMTARGQLPGRQIAEGVMLAVAGALLLTPGYFTDACGFVLLIPPARRLIYDFLAARIEVVSTGPYTTRPQQRRDDGVIDLDGDDWRDQ